MESKIETAKRIVKSHYERGDCGIFDSRNIAGELIDIIYDDGSLQIGVCYHYSYFEVLGLSDSEFRELEDFYDSLKNKYGDNA